MPAFNTEKVLSVRHWNDTLFSFTTTRDPSFRFRAGQCVLIGLEVNGKPLLRAYSMVSAPHEDHQGRLTDLIENGRLFDAAGNVLAQRQTQEGPGIVVATIELGAQPPRLPIADRFWVPELPLAMRLYWHQQNACGKAYYRQEGRARGLASARRHAVGFPQA